MKRQFLHRARADAKAQIPAAEQGVPTEQFFLRAVFPVAQKRVGAAEHTGAAGGQQGKQLTVLDDGDDIHHLTADALGQTDDDAGGIFAAGKEQLVERLLALGENSGIIQKIAGGRRTQSKAGKKREVRVERFVFLQQIGDGITAKLRVAADDAVDTAAQADDRIHNKHPFYDGLRRLFLTASNAPKGSGRHKKTPSRSGWSCKAERAAQAAARCQTDRQSAAAAESSAPSAPFCIRSCRA